MIRPESVSIGWENRKTGDETVNGFLKELHRKTSGGIKNGTI
jgi:hypothetical protein